MLIKKETKQNKQKKNRTNKKKAPKTPILQKQNPNKENQEDFLGNFIFWQCKIP